MAMDAAARLRRHLLDAAVGSVGDVLLGFRLRLSVPLAQSSSGCQKQRRFPQQRSGWDTCPLVRSRSGRAGRNRFFSAAIEAGHYPDQRRRRPALRGWFLFQLGYLSAFSLRRVLWRARSALWGRCRVLCFSSALLPAVANQSDVADSVGAGGRRSRLHVLWIIADDRQRVYRVKRHCHFTPVRPAFYSDCQLGLWALPRSL